MSEAGDRGTGDHLAVEQARKMTFEVSIGRESSQGNVPLFKSNFKDADAGSEHLCSSLALEAGLDFTDKGHLGHPQFRDNSSLFSLENRAPRILPVVRGSKASGL